MDRQHVTVIRQVLDGLRFPAQRWQLIAQGTLYGADVVTMAKLHRLPPRLYVDCDDVTAEIIATARRRPTVTLPVSVPGSVPTRADVRP